MTQSRDFASLLLAFIVLLALAWFQIWSLIQVRDARDAAQAELAAARRDLAAARRALEARPILVESPPPDTQNCLCVLPNDRAYFECRMRLKENP